MLSWHRTEPVAHSSKSIIDKAAEVESATSPNVEAVPVVSVAVLTYNHERFLADALESIYRQQDAPRTEVIIAVDASDDQTLDVAKSFLTKAIFPTRILATNVRLGMQANLRRLLAESRGKYIALIEGDDFWTEPKKLKWQVDFLEENPEAVGCCTYAQVRIEPPLRREEHNWVADVIPTLSPGMVPLRALATMRNQVPTASLMIRSTRFRELPSWLLDLPMADWYFTIGSCTSGGLFLLPHETCVYRVHGAGATLNTEYRKFADAFGRMLEGIWDECEKSVRPELALSLRSFLWEQASVSEASGDGSIIERLRTLSRVERKLFGRVSARTMKWTLRIRYPMIYSSLRRLAKAMSIA